MKLKIHIEETFEQILYYVVYADCTLSSFQLKINVCVRPNEFMSTHTEIHISLRDLEKFFRKLKSKLANDLKLSLTI